jgi:hypothetical protein
MKYTRLLALAALFSTGLYSQITPYPVPGGGGGGAVSSVFGRTGTVAATSGDYTAAQVTGAEATANKNTNGGYVGRDGSGNATITGTFSAGALTLTGGLPAQLTGPVTSSNPSSPSVGSAILFFSPTAVGTTIDSTGAVTATQVVPASATANSFVTAISSAGVQTVGKVVRTCMVIVGADNGSALVNGDLGPQLNQCQIPYAGTILEIDVMGDAGTPNVIVQRSHLGTPTALLSGALATAASGAVACAKTGATTGVDGTTTCSATLQNKTIAAGDWIGLTSGTAGGVAKRMSIAVHWQ